MGPWGTKMAAESLTTPCRSREQRKEKMNEETILQMNIHGLTLSPVKKPGKMGKENLESYFVWQEFCCWGARSMPPSRNCPRWWRSQREFPGSGHLGTCRVTDPEWAQQKDLSMIFKRDKTTPFLWLGKKNILLLTPPLLKTAPCSPRWCVWYRITSAKTAPLIPVPRTATQQNEMLRASRSSDVCLQEQTLQVLKPCFMGSSQT